MENIKVIIILGKSDNYLDYLRFKTAKKKDLFSFGRLYPVVNPCNGF